MIAIYMDTRSDDRQPRAYAVSVTKVKNGIVLRYAAELPSVPDYAEVLIVDRTGYKASSSAGHYTVLGARTNALIVGELTFDRPLHPVAPRAVTIVQHANRRKIRTHKNSNPATADAAYDLLADAYQGGDKLLLLWGQSDETSAAYISGGIPDLDALDVLEEHRTDIINPLSVETSRIMRSYYLEYYNQSYDYPTQSKHDYLRAKAIGFLLGYKTNWREDTEAITEEVAREIVRRLARKGEDISDIHVFAGTEYADEATKAEVASKAAACRDDIVAPSTLVDGVHVGDEDGRTYTWVVPDGMSVSEGETVTAGTTHGDVEVIVRRVYRGLPGKHRRLVQA